jgi:FkbM family methyltransferase
MNKTALSIIKSGARLPLYLKGGIIERVFTRLLRWYRNNYMDEHLVFSNLGISNKLKVAFPIQQAPSMFFFGTPASYTGEYYTVKLVSLLTRHSSSFVDIGANWGFFSYYIRTENASVPIYWFEPNPALYKSIITNSASNGLSDMVGSQQAISDSNGALTFYVEDGSGFNSSLVRPPENEKIKEITVEVIRFDDWIEQNGIAGNLMVKVDVENAEWNFIKGVTKEFDKIEFLVIEVLGPARQSGFINYMISERKMEAYYINGPRVEHVPQEDMRYTKGEYNWLFCRHKADVLRKKLEGSVFTIIG